MKGMDWDPPFSAAVTTTLDWPPGTAVAAAAVTEKVAVEDAAGMVTTDGTARVGVSLVTAMATPPAGAALERLTVHVLLEPAFRLVGLHARVESSTGLRLKVKVAELSHSCVFRLAVTVTLWLVVKLPAVAVKVMELAPAATVTEGGILSRPLLALSWTFRAWYTPRFRTTVQVPAPAGSSAVGLQLTEVTDAVGTSARNAVCEEPFKVAVSVTLAFAESVPTVVVKLAEVVPAGTVKVAGMSTAELLADSVTTLPPDPAA